MSTARSPHPDPLPEYRERGKRSERKPHAASSFPTHLRRGFFGGFFGHHFSHFSRAFLGGAGLEDDALAFDAVERVQSVGGLLDRLATRTEVEPFQTQPREFLAAVGIGRDRRRIDGGRDLVEA